MMSVTQSRLNASQASTSTPRGPSSDHSAISTAPVSEAGTIASAIAVRQFEQLARAGDRQREPRLGLGLAVIAAEQRALQPVRTDQPGRLVQGPDEKRGLLGRTVGLSVVTGSISFAGDIGQRHSLPIATGAHKKSRPSK